MRKTNFFVTLVLILSILFTALGLYGIKVKAEVPANVGLLAEDALESFPWLKGREEKIKDLFIDAYVDQGWTEEGTSKIVPIAFNNARVGLVQIFGEDIKFEGALFLNEIDGDKVLVVDDPSALLELQSLLVTGNNNTNGILLDIVNSDGKTYYITDRRNEDGIFSMVEDTENPGTMIAEYLPYRIGLGKGTYGDIMWVEYTKAYKFASQYMESLGLPKGAVATYRYVTADLNDDGKYTGTSSEKAYTKQEFENGWIIQARMQVLSNPETGALGGHQSVQHGAAPIMNDMYALVLGLDGNAELSVTGAPVSIEFNVGGVRYQNFEYGYVKVTEGVAEFVVDLVVDELGTPMNRRIGITRTWDNIRTGNADNNGIHAIGWERLRISQNFRNVVGQLIREGVLPEILTDAQVVHSGVNAPQDGIWFSFKDAKNPDGTTASYLGAANLFVFHTSWYDTARPLLTYLNTANYVDAKDGIGRPISDYKQIYNVYYQEFKGGIGFYNTNNNQITRVLKADLATWLDGAESIEAALITKDIAQAAHKVTFKDKDGNVIDTETVDHGEAAVGIDAPILEHYVFEKWSLDISAVIKDMTVTPVYKPVDYDITYKLDGGVNHPDNPDKANILSNIDLKAPEKPGFFFVGWYLDAEHTTEVTKLSQVKGDMTVYALYTESVSPEEIVGVFAPGSVPDWIKGSEVSVKTEFLRVYELAEFVDIPTQNVQSIQLNRTRVMIYQIIPGEGVIVMNERDGVAMFTKNLPVINAYISTLGTENASILLGIIEFGGVEYFVTDQGILYLDGANLTVHEFQIGVGSDLALFDDALASPFTLEVVLNDFANAYKFAENYMESLGLPTSAVIMKDYTTIDLDGTNAKATGTSSSKKYYMQAFENGYIMMNSHGENIQYGAAPIQKDFYDLVKEIEGNADFSKTGTPVSVEMEIDGIRYQNFEFGYVKIVDGVAVYVDGWVVDNQGYELNRRVGTPLRFINWHWETKNREEYLVGWERLRITQNLRNAIGDLFRLGITPYKVTKDDPFGDAGIHESSSRAGGSSGIWQIFKHAEGWPALGWGNVFLLQGYWYNKPYVLDPLFNVPEFVDDKGMGRPVDYSHQLYNATYQLFDNGIGFFNGVRVEGQPNWVSIKGEDFVTWMGSHATVEEALIANGVAEEKHTVTWLAQDGVTILKTEQVAHGEAATPPTAPEIPGLVFSSWSPEDYNNIILPNRTFVAIYGSETGEPQSGTYKFINYDTDGSSANFWYENPSNVIQVNETLFSAFRASKITMAESIAVNGLPIYADDKNLITTLYHFQIDENDSAVVNKLATIGNLDETVTSLQNGNIGISLNENMKLIIQDSFGDAYIFTWDRGQHLLGLPLGPAKIEKLYPNPGVLTEFIDIIVQEFEHGFIMQEAYDNPAYSIYGKTYDEWLALEGFDGLGSPTSREFSYLGVTYQNFKYGYIAIEGEVVTPTFTESNQIDFKGRPIHKLAGRAESRANVKIAHPEFEHELLRIYEEFMKLYTEMKDQGLIFDHAIEMVHEWNGWGLTQGFNPSLSSANVWGQANFTHVDMETPYTSVYLIKDDMLTQYAALSGNETFGFPISNEFKVEVELEHEDKEVKLEVTYQNFTAGYIRAYLVGDVKVIEYFRDAFVTEEGVHMVDGEVSETPEWDLSGLIEDEGIDKTGLQKKLNDLKAEKAKVKVLVGDIKNLPSNQLFITQELMDAIDAKIAEVEAIIADEDVGVAEITQALVELDALITNVKNQSVAGDGQPVDPDEPEKAGLPGWAIAIIVIGSVAVLAGIGFVVYTFVIKKRK